MLTTYMQIKRTIPAPGLTACYAEFHFSFYFAVIDIG
jgi:hypothetical protein